MATLNSRILRTQYVEAMRDGRHNKADTFEDDSKVNVRPSKDDIVDATLSEWGEIEGVRL